MNTRKRNFGWGDAIAAFLAALVLVAVVYPAFVQSHRDNRTRSVVLDENRRPIAGAVVQIRSADGHELARMTTDANGLFLWKRDWQKQGTTFGDYGLTRYSHSSGGRDQVFITRLAQHDVQVVNGVNGREQQGIRLSFSPDINTLSYPSHRHGEVLTDENGTANSGTFPQLRECTFKA